MGVAFKCLLAVSLGMRVGFSFEEVLVVGNSLCHFYLLKKSMILCLGRPIMAF
jgi:hypothetical protein